MKWKVELQTVLVMVCAIAIVALFLILHIIRNDFGTITERAELHFTTPDLFRIQPRAEVTCAGTVVGHVRETKLSTAADGAPEFLIVVGIKKDFALSRFSTQGKVNMAPVDSSLLSSSINLTFAATNDSAFALPLEPQHSRLATRMRALLRLSNDDTAAKFPKYKLTKTEVVTYDSVLGNIHGLISDLRNPSQDAQTPSANFGRSLNDAAATLEKLKLATRNLDTLMENANKFAADLPAFTKAANSIDQASDHLAKMTAPGGDIQAMLKDIGKTIGTTEKAVSSLNDRVQLSLDKWDIVADSSSDKIKRFGETPLMKFLAFGKERDPAKKSQPTLAKSQPTRASPALAPIAAGPKAASR